MFGGKWMDRIDRWGVWVLLLIVLLYIFTGYGMTKHIIDPVLARYIHVELLPVPLLIFFLIHVLKSVHRQFKNWHIFKDQRLLDIYVYILGGVMTGLFLWLYLR